MLKIIVSKIFILIMFMFNNNINIVEYLEMYLQSFQIFEIKDNGLKIQIEAG